MVRYIKKLAMWLLAAVFLLAFVTTGAAAQEDTGEKEPQTVQLRLERDSAELAAPMTELGFEGTAFLVSLSVATVLQLVRMKWGVLWEFSKEN